LNHPYLRFQAHGDWVWMLAFSPDGEILASGSDDSRDTLKLWNAETGDLLRTLNAPDSRVRALGWSPDQTLLASSGVDGAVRIWGANSGNCLSVLKAHDNKASALAWQPLGDADLLATGSADGTIRIWNAASGKCQQTISVGDSVFCVAWSPDGQRLASGGSAGPISIWSLAGEQLGTLEGHQNTVWSVAWAPSGLASGGDDRSIRLWHPDTGQCLRVLQGHQNAVRSLHWRPPSPETASSATLGEVALLASGSFDQTVRLWSPRADASLKVLQGYRNSLLGVAWHPEGQLISGGHDGLIRVWNAQTGDCLATLEGHSRPIWAIACSHHGVASSGDDRTIRLWDLKTRRPTATLTGHQDTIWGLAWHPAEAMLASASHDQTVRLWEVETGRCLQVLTGHQHFVRAIAWSPDGKVLASGSYDQTLRLWDAGTGDCLRVLRDPENWVWKMAFSPDGQTLATGSTNGDIKLWNAATGEHQRTLTGHLKSVWGLAWRPDGQSLVSSSHDHTVRIWRTRDGRCLYRLTEHEKLDWDLALNPEGTVIASCGVDDTIRLWDAATGASLRVLRPLRPYEGMNITNVQGLTPAQQQNLKALGATTTVAEGQTAAVAEETGAKKTGAEETHPQSLPNSPVAPANANGDEDAVTPLPPPSPPLVIRLLGTFSLTYQHQPLPSTMAGRSQSLLAYLLLHQPWPQSRQQIAAALWPDSLEGQARTNLRKELHHLRRYLPEAEQYLQVDSTTLGWRPDAPFWLDVTAFEQAAAASADAEAETRAALAHRQRAVDVYKGELLPPLYDEWLTPHRDRLHQQFLQTLAQLTNDFIQQNDYAAALLQAQRLLQLDPMREATYQSLMQIHAGLGDRAAALQVYHQCMEVLREELGIDPSARTQEIYGMLLD
ncbi:MAG: BTAD domain-containing putative transcriptional regulator, partial [Elainellaceae cyanobacterium]